MGDQGIGLERSKRLGFQHDLHSCLSPPIAIHSLVGFLAGFLVALVLAAVPGLLALRQGDFVLVQEQLARAQRFVIPWAAGQVLSDVGVDQPGATGLEIDVGVADIGLPLAKGFYFGAMEDQAGIIALQEMVIVGSGAVLRDDLLFGLVGLFGLFGRFRH